MTESQGSAQPQFTSLDSSNLEGRQCRRRVVFLIGDYEQSEGLKGDVRVILSLPRVIGSV